MEDTLWTVRRILSWIEGYLAQHKDENPRLSAQWLVSSALGIERIQLFLDPERPLSEGERALLRDYTRRRGAGEPLQYITGSTDFRFITVAVEPGVLIPRPETEVLVSEALAELEVLARLKEARIEAGLCAVQLGQEGEDTVQEKGDLSPNVKKPGEKEGENAAGSGDNPQSSPEIGGFGVESAELRVLDLCTGSGCIACSIASEVPHARVWAGDIDPKAVNLAKKNAAALGVQDRVFVYQGDLAEGLGEEDAGSFHLLISNPPYIPSGLLAGLSGEVRNYESSQALDGGEDGLLVFRRILPLGMQLLAEGGVLALELHEECLDAAACEAQQAGYEKIRIARDLAGRPRVLVARKG